MAAIVREQPDIVSVNREHDLLPTWISAKLSAPFLRRTHKLAAVFHTPTGRSIPVLRYFDGIVCTSLYTAQGFARTNPSVGAGISVIPYGIRLWPTEGEGKFRRDRERRFFKGRDFPIIGMVGELWKNQEELVEAARIIVREIPSATIAIVGGGWDHQVAALKRKTLDLGLEDHVLLTGRVDRGRIPDIFHDFDLSVSTHRNEGFGIVHIESLASLTPVVAYNSGGYVEMLRDGGGVLVEGGTQEFAETVVKLLRDDALRRRLGEEGRRIVESRYTLERMGQAHLEYYRRLAGGGRASRGSKAA
jgi:glycosyltransferase involved in cell wall biosynthesis